MLSRFFISKFASYFASLIEHGIQCRGRVTRIATNTSFHVRIDFNVTDMWREPDNTNNNACESSQVLDSSTHCDVKCSFGFETNFDRYECDEFGALTNPDPCNEITCSVPSNLGSGVIGAIGTYNRSVQLDWSSPTHKTTHSIHTGTSPSCSNVTTLNAISQPNSCT